MRRRQILLTNDDGIQSPGLWAAAEALSSLGFVTVVAPREQSSGMGRSLPSTSDGVISKQIVQVGGQEWTVHAVGGSPAQAVLYGVLEIMPRRPDLVVSGINYGENLAMGVTISGTVGAALEAAALGIPALAVSLETARQHHLSYSTRVNFSTAAHFTVYFARCLLEKEFPEDVDVLNINLPSNATPQTPWKLTRLARRRYFEPLRPKRTAWDEPASVGYRRSRDALRAEEGTDIYALRMERCISVTPLSLDMTSRVDFKTLDTLLRQE